MPQTDLGALLFVGAVFFLIGILGGGFEISAIKIPSVGKTPRLISAGIGIIFMGIALIRLIFPYSSPSANSALPTETSTSPSSSTNIAASPTNTLTLGNASRHPAPYHILLDTYHAATLPFNSVSSDFIVDEATSTLTTQLLSNYDVVVINFTHHDERPQYSVNELIAIKEYVTQGGSAFLIGLGWVWAGKNQPIADNPLNIIAADSGIFFTERYINNVGGVSYKDSPIVFRKPFMIDHPITQGINMIGAANSAPGSLTIKTPAIALISGDNDTQDSGGFMNPAILAASTLGKGKIVCLQHSKYVIPYVDTYENATFSTSDFDNIKLLQNILSWLISQ